MGTRAIDFDKYYREISASPSINIKGRVTQVIGLVMEVSGIRPPVGELCLVEAMGVQSPY